VNDVGPIVAQSIHTFFAQPHNCEIVEQLRACGITWKEDEGTADTTPKPLLGKTFVLTGTLPTLSRDAAKDMIEAAGGKVSGSYRRRRKLRRRGRGGRQQARQGARARRGSARRSGPAGAAEHERVTAMDWLQGLRARADQAPVVARDALLVEAGATPIGSVEPSLAARMLAAGLPIMPTPEGWCVIGAPLNAAFARIAEWLRAQGLASAWRNELLGVCDASGASVGMIERAAVRPLGITTHAVHLVAGGAGRRMGAAARARQGHRIRASGTR